MSKHAPFATFELAQRAPTPKSAWGATVTHIVEQPLFLKPVFILFPAQQKSEQGVKSFCSKQSNSTVFSDITYLMKENRKKS